MTDASRTFVATAVGAVIGGIAGYMFFTEKGQAVRRQLEPVLDDLTRELNQFRGTFTRAAGVASEGWRLLNEALGEGPDAGRYQNPRQSSPF